MSGEIIKLKYLTEEIQAELKRKIEQSGGEVAMACVMVGEDPSSLSYISGIKRNAEKLGVQADILTFQEDIPEEELATKINELNNDIRYSGIIIQMPLPKHINRYDIASIINYKKDIDGISPYNLGLLFNSRPFMIPATAWAVNIALKRLAKERNISLAGKTAAILGRSVTVGKPVLHLLLKNDITPTITHTKSVDVESITSEADIVVACCGVSEMIKGSWIKPGAIVLDVGINTKVNSEGKTVLCGDVDAADVCESDGIVTAVPGGIGSLTSSLLYANCVKGYFMLHRNENIIFDFEV